jgi:isopentenyl phosphate kinase
MFSSLFVQSIETALQAGAIPLLHGDMVFDRAWGLSILSGDVLLAKLAKQFKVSKIFFASDVDGVFSEDPHRFQNATLVQTTTLEKLNQTAKLTSSHNQDVTGGLAKKFTYLQGIRSLRSIYFFNGLIPKNFSFLFDQKDFFGTVIHKK